MFSLACVVILVVVFTIAVSCGAKLVDVLLWFFLLIPPMSHIWHIIWGEGTIRDGDPIWNTYEVAVFAEVALLRLYTTVGLFERQMIVAALISLVSGLISFVLPFGLGGRVYDWLALVVDVKLIIVVVLTIL